MTHGSLFSGIGGFDLAAKWMGWNNVFHCELNPFGRRILKHYWPKTNSYEDIKTTDFSIYRGLIDVLSGGDPCQRNSNANRSGDEVAESLGGEFLRVVREIMPGTVVRENPATVRKDAPWPARRFADVLESYGYVVPYPLKMRACCTGGRIRRERMFVLAFLPQSLRTGLEGHVSGKMENAGSGRSDAHFAGPDWRHTEPSIFRKPDGLPPPMDGITLPAWRKESIKAFGNAVVPRVAYEIFKAIESFEK